MRINIYGVGRSGTKAIQLYLSYLLARKEEVVWINYEPYFWCTRKTRAMNFEGFYYHSTSPHLVSDKAQLTSKHKVFLKKLADKDCSVVTKFIRGNGRIGAINGIMQPDYTFIIIRDLYEVLKSLMQTEWDFWSVGWDYNISWEKFVNEVSRASFVDNFTWCLKKIIDRTDQNAFYWYVMNLAALTWNSPKYFLIHYNNISEVESIANDIFDISDTEEDISSFKFSGDLLHENYPLISEENINFRNVHINQLLYKAQILPKLGWFIPPTHVGSKAFINKDFYLEKPKIKSTVIGIERKELYDFFNEDILKRYNQIKFKPATKPVV